MPFGEKIKIYYDALGRVVRTVNPDASEQRAVFGVPVALDKPLQYTPTPWESYSYDAEDLDNGSDYYATPKSVEVDALGRSIRTMDRLVSNDEVDDNVRMLYGYDIRGNLLEVADALDRTVFQYTYDLRPPAKEGESIPPLKTTHIDKGTSTIVFDCMGKPLQGDDAKGALTLSAFDTLMRPTNAWARDVTGEDITLRQVMIYGTTTTVNVNNKGKLIEHYDEAGYEGTFNYDFKGNLLNKYRQVISDTELLSVFDGPPTDWDVQCYRVDWTGGPSILDSEAYHTDMSYDALNRIMTMEYPEDTESERKILTPTYNKAGALQSVTLDSVEYVKEIAYNAKGQRLLIALGNGIMTRYTYDPATFRLQRLKTEGYTYTDTSSSPLYQKKYDYNPGTTKQDFAYGYDLVGNILSINNTTPGCGNGGSDELNRQFTYDALYRLLSGTGRENQPNISWFPGWDDTYRSYNAGTTTGYSQSYNYDRMGNFTTLAHSGSTSFNRNFDYVSGKNLLDSITIGGNSYTFDYDNNGNLITENTERHFEWDYADQMRCFFNQTGTSEPSIYTQYLYAGGTRVKKITRKSSGDKYITVYIDGIFEYSYHLDGSNTMDEELNELHVMDDQTRVAMLRTGYDDGTPFTKYILSDHLGSSNVILENDGSVYNREEYYPFGETSFGSFGKKRYRYCGKEKDEESGLYYYGARYFQPWSCRFISVDPLAGKYANLSPYNYADNTPITDKDIDGMQNTTSATTPPDQGQEITFTDPKANTNLAINNFVWSGGTSHKGIKITGSDENINDFLNLLNKRTGNTYSVNVHGFIYNKGGTVNSITDNEKSGQLSQIVEDLINGDQVIPIDLTKDSVWVDMDNFATAQVDVGDLIALSYSELQAGLIAHFLIERAVIYGYANSANRSTNSYYIGHEKALAVESNIVNSMIRGGNVNGNTLFPSTMVSQAIPQTETFIKEWEGKKYSITRAKGYYFTREYGNGLVYKFNETFRITQWTYKAGEWYGPNEEGRNYNSVERSWGPFSPLKK